MKTYLKDLTPEEIIKRLKNGEILHPVNPDFYIKMIDGVLCEFYNNELKFINVQVGSVYRPDSNEGYNFYFETEEPLTFEEGKFYKTRDGKKAYISKITTTRFYGIITGKTSLETWSLKGTHWYHKSPHKNDLISKWEE